MAIRDHEPITIDSFNGLYDRGDIESTPMDHFSDCNNIKFAGPSGFSTRDGIGLHQSVSSPLGQILRFYNYSTDQGNTLLVLTEGGTIYHVINSVTVFGPILTIGTMEDFAFVQFAGRAYISPFKTEVRGDLNIERGLQNEYLYVYKGDGTAARRAAGAAPGGALTVANGAAGFTDAGLHVFAVVGETDTGYLSKPVAFASFTTGAALSVNFTTIPIFAGAQWIKRHIVASIVIQDFAGNLDGYDMFFIPGADINNNVATTLSNISFFDSDLVKDATHLEDNFDNIPAGVALFTYHNRLVSVGEYDNISVARVSAVGEPEAISTIDGLLSVPPDGNPLTNGAELRDVCLHIFAVVGETDTGYLSKPVAFASFTTGAALSVNFTTIPIFAGAQWIKRHIVASIVIQDFAGNLDGYDMFFIPGADINNNVATTLSNISFFDSDLVKDATHLEDNFDNIPAGVALFTYHNRLVSVGEYDNISVARVSAVGEPEAISTIDGLLSVPPDGNPLTNGAELRDVCYLTKRNKTVSYVDNGDTPVNWPYSSVDTAMGTGVHGLGTVVDTGSSSIDYLIVATYKGIALFNGRYILPELSWKIQNRWAQQNFKTEFRRVQILNDSVKSLLYVIMTDRTMQFADYKNGFDPKAIRWTPWTFDVLINTIALINVSELLLGADQV